MYNIVMTTQYREVDKPEVPVPLSQLRVGTRIPCDMFIIDGMMLKVLFNRNALYTNDARDILKEKGISNVYIFKRDVPHFDLYISKTGSPKKPLNEETSASFKKYASLKEQHHQIDPSILIHGSTINFSLSVLDRFNVSILLEASVEYPAVVDTGILQVAGDIVINKSDLPRYHEYITSLRKHDKFIESDDTRIMALAIRETSKVVLQNFLEDPRSGEKIKEVEILVNDIINCIL